MHQKYLVISVLFLVLVLSLQALGDTDLRNNCTIDQQCTDLYAGYNLNVYCNPQTSTCYATGNAQGSSAGTSTTTATGTTTGTAATPLTNGSTTPSTTLTASTASSSTVLTPSTTFSTTASTATVSSLDIQKLNTLDTEVKNLQQKINLLETNLNSLTSQVGDINSKVTSAIGELTSQQLEIKDEVKSEVKNVVVGLAGLQENVVKTQEDFAKTKEDVEDLQLAVEETPGLVKIIVYVLIVLAVVALGLGGIYLVEKMRHPGMAVSESIVDYISSHIKAGRKYQHIHQDLQKAGWQPADIQKAYKDTLKRNYTAYSQQKEKQMGYDKQKTIFISIVGVLLIIGIFFLVKGVTGQAIHFDSGVGLDAAVKNMLDTRIDENLFYPLVESAAVCFEVNDLKIMSAYRVNIASGTHTVEKVNSCDVNNDLSLTFNDWDTFNIIMRNPTCEKIKQFHSKGFYILPSKYIFPGFMKNPFEDSSRFCNVLQVCLTPEELSLAGC